MAVLALGAVGAAAAGSAVGATATGTFLGLSAATWAGIGWTVGTIAGQYLFGPSAEAQDFSQQGPRLGDTIAKGGSYGQPIPRVWGRDRVAGGIIWKRPIREEVITTVIESEGGGGKGGKGGGGATTTITNYEYYGTFAVQLCEGEIDIKRLWANSKLVRDPDNQRYELDQYMTVYRGTADQLPDALMESYEGIGNVPAYRHVAYIVFDDVPLKDFNNALPNVEVECLTLQEEPAHELQVIDYAYTSGANAKESNRALYVDGSFLWLMSPMSFLNVGTFDITAYITKVDIATGALVDGYDDVINSPLPGGSSADSHHAFCGGKPYVFFETGIYSSGAPPGWTGITYYADYNIMDIRDQTFSGTMQIPLAQQGSDTIAGLSFYNGYYYTATKTGIDIVVVRFPETFQTQDVQYQVIPTPQGWGGSYFPRKILVDGATGRIYFLNQPQSGAWELVSYDWGGSLGDRQPISTISRNFDSLHAYMYNSRLFIFATSDPNNSYATFVVAADGTSTITNKGIVAGAAGAGGYFPVPYGTAQALTSRGRWLATDNLYDSNVGDIVQETCVRCGLQPSEIDTTLLNYSILGYVRAGPMSGRALIEGLQKILAFDAVETGGKIKFVPQDDQSGETGITVLGDDLAVHLEGAETPAEVAVTRMQELEMPRHVRVAHKNLQQDYDIGVQAVSNPVTESRSVVQVELPAVLQEGQAKNIARRLMNQSTWSRLLARWTLGTKHMALEPADLIAISASNADYKIRVTACGFTAPSILAYEGVITDASIYDTDETADTTLPPPQMPVLVPSDVAYLDIPILRNVDAAYEGHYAYGWGLGTGTWPGGTLYYAGSAGLWVVGTVWSEGREATFGTLNNSVPGVTHPWMWDDANTLDVTLSKGTLTSSTDEDVQAGANHAAIGINGRWEILGFVNVVDNGNGNYTLSRLLRARRGTEHVLGTSQAQDDFVFLDDIGIRRVNLPTGSIGVPYNYRMVDANDRLANATSETFAAEGVGSMPFAPTHIFGTWDGAAQSARIEWTARTRCTADEQFMGEDYGDCESIDQYHVEIRPQGASALLRTIVVDDATSTTYTLAAYQADSGDGSATIIPALDVTVYRISATIGRGYPGTGTILS